jgi:nucleoid-associated protein YgaU
MLSPVLSAGQGLVRAHLEILKPEGFHPLIPICFNPTEYQVQRTNNFAEIAIPGLETPPIQFVRGAGEKLTTEFLVDTSDTLADVRLVYVNRLRDLLNINGTLHAPPVVRLVWATQIFKGVLESLNATYTMFTPDGIPLRAKLGVSLKEYRTVREQLAEIKKNSPDVEKSYVVRRGDTLSSIAAAVFEDGGLWRPIAQANGIQDPRLLVPGRTLTIPRLI